MGAILRRASEHFLKSDRLFRPPESRFRPPVACFAGNAPMRVRSPT
jgi:hypothetical protein